MEPQIQYTKTSDGKRIAFAVVGAGSPVVLFPEPGVSLIEAARIPEWSSWLENLALKHRAVLIDARGFGNSDLAAVVQSPDEFVQDVHAVVTALQLAPFAVLAQGSSCRIALKFAIDHRELVSHLILVGPLLGHSGFLQEAPMAENGVVVLSLWDDWIEERVASTRHLSHSHRDARKKLTDISAGGSHQKMEAVQDALALIDGHELAGNVNLPTLVLIDDAEPAEQQEEMRRAVEAIPGAEQSTVSVGSWMMYEDSNGQIIENLDTFLASPAVAHYT